MRSLFLKIFLSFWLITGLIVVISVLTSERPRRAEAHQLWRALIEGAIPVNADSALEAYEGSGCRGLGGFVQGPLHASHLVGFLFDAQGTQLCGPPAPHAAVALAQTAPSNGVAFTPPQNFAAMRQTSASGREYVFVLGVPGPPPVPPWRRGTHLAIALAVSGIVCFILARYLARPIGTVRMAAQQMAAGNLQARAGPPATARNDEVGDLARDFDHMAARLESLFHAQGRLITDISHELRSPLARLNVALGIARQQATGAEAVAFDRIEREIERLNQMIGRLLTLSRLEAASESPAHTTVDLAGLLRETVADADFEARSRNCRVVITHLEECVAAGNPELLRSALENVLRNAIQYTAAETTVEASLRCSGEAAARQAEIQVRDHGPGAPENELTNLFRPFYRLDQSRERQTGGAGLGLAIVQRAILLHHGTAAAMNAPGGGLLLRLTVPLLPPETASPVGE